MFSLVYFVFTTDLYQLPLYCRTCLETNEQPPGVGHSTVIALPMLASKHPTQLNPSSAAVPFRGQTTYNLSGFPPKRDCSPIGVNSRQPNPAEACSFAFSHYSPIGSRPYGTTTAVLRSKRDTLQPPGVVRSGPCSPCPCSSRSTSAEWSSRTPSTSTSWSLSTTSTAGELFSSKTKILDHLRGTTFEFGCMGISLFLLPSATYLPTYLPPDPCFVIPTAAVHGKPKMNQILYI